MLRILSGKLRTIEDLIESYHGLGLKEEPLTFQERHNLLEVEEDGYVKLFTILKKLFILQEYQIFTYCLVIRYNSKLCYLIELPLLETNFILFGPLCLFLFFLFLFGLFLLILLIIRTWLVICIRVFWNKSLDIFVFLLRVFPSFFLWF